MAVIASFKKQPVERLDYNVDYEPWLDSGDSLSEVTTSVSPAGELAVFSSAIIGKRIQLWISDGVDKKTYKVTVTVTTSAGRIKQDEVSFSVKEY